MPILEQKIPATPLKFYSDIAKPQNKAALDRIYSTYQNEIDTASRLTKVPKDIITSFIFIESNGQPNIVSPAGAIGLMQLMVGASDVLVIENMKQRFSQEEKDAFTKFLGKRFTDGILKMKFLGDKKTIDGITYDGVTQKYLTKADLVKPAFNILLGAVYLGILIDESTKNGKCNLHKVVIRYNKGYFADKKGASIPDSVDEAVASANTESKNYILKLMGSNGLLETLGVA